MLLKDIGHVLRHRHERRFSTLYRVDAIEGSIITTITAPRGSVSVPSIGSMLLKAPSWPSPEPARCPVSVPSIGSMLLKAWWQMLVPLSYFSFSTLYRVDAIEGAGECGGAVVVGGGFSTLYRVDAIEG